MLRIHTLIVLLLISFNSQASFFNFGSESYKECSFLPLKKNYEEGFRPYFDDKKEFCVVPVETDATRTQGFEDSFAVDWEQYFKESQNLLHEVENETLHLNSLKSKLGEYETYFQDIQNFMEQFKNAPPYARPQIDLKTPMAQYQDLLERIENLNKEIESLLLESQEKNPVKGFSIFHHRGFDYPYFWHKKRTRFVVFLLVPHGKSLKDVKKKFKNSNFFNSLSDMGSGFRDMANDVSPAMSTMKRDMQAMREAMAQMRTDMSVMATAIPDMATNFTQITELMGQMTESVGRMGQAVGQMSSSVGGMSNQMQKPFMGMFSFLPFM